MSVSKRLRFEILRRDNHQCQYCGEKAPDVTLHVDHVIPVALGGSDKPENLVAACKDCNLGKTSLPASAPLVASIGTLSAGYALEMVDRMTQIRGSLELEDEYYEEFESAWNVWTCQGKRIPLPADHQTSIYRWARMGVPVGLIERAIKTAMTKEGLRPVPHAEFNYMAGVVWRTLEDTGVSPNLSAATVRLYTELEFEEKLTDERIDAWMKGRASVGA